MLSILAYTSLLVAVVAFVFAIKGKVQLYWISAIGIYLFSFLAGFSIGQLTVGLTFIPLALGFGYSFGWIKNKVHSIVFFSIGLLMGILMVYFVDDAWLFFPFWFLG